MDQSAETLRGLLLVIALISATLGAASVFNLMTMAAQERKKEIGVRLAIGALPTDIVTMFVVEAVAIATASSLIGVSLGGLIACTVQAATSTPLAISLGSIVMSLSLSMLTAVTGALYPAWKASRLTPCEVLQA